ncbi:MAG: DUF6282 family protein [Candidatus Caldarchaeum sp.]
MFSVGVSPSRPLREYSGLLEGVVDLHVHTAPDVLQRSVDDLEFTRFVGEIGYAAYLAKNHFTETASRAYLLRKISGRVKVFGAIVLNSSVGGLNPSAVEKALAMGAAEVWMPTLSADNHIKMFGTAALLSTNRVKTFSSYSETSRGITVLDQSGDELKPEITPILQLVAESNAILGTGHLSLREIFKLIDAAKKTGVGKILITHPHFKATRFSTEDQVRLADMGAVIEHCAVAGYDPKALAEDIRRVGVGRCIISSDAGQPHKGHPVDVLLKMIEELREHGLSDSDIQRLTKSNPMKLVEDLT